MLFGTESWLRELHNSRPSVGGRYRFPGQSSEGACCRGRFGFAELGPGQFISQHAVKVELDILGSELPSVHWRLVMPVDALADVEDKGGGVGLFPALRQRPAKGGQRRRIAANEMKCVPVYGPVHRAQFLIYDTDELTRSTAKPGVTRLNSGSKDIGQCRAILWRGEHLAGDGVGHVPLVSGCCRVVAVAAAGGKRSGRHQRERQCYG